MNAYKNFTKLVLRYKTVVFYSKPTDKSNAINSAHFPPFFCNTEYYWASKCPLSYSHYSTAKVILMNLLFCQFMVNILGGDGFIY